MFSRSRRFISASGTTVAGGEPAKGVQMLAPKAARQQIRNVPQFGRRRPALLKRFNAEMGIVSMPPDATARVEGNWQNCEWSNDAQMWYGLHRVGEAVELRSDRCFTGRHRVVLRASRYPDYGTIAVSVNGERIGEPVDLWRDEGLRHTGPLELGVMTMAGEQPTFRFELVGHHPEAQNTGTFFGIDCIELLPIKDPS